MKTGVTIIKQKNVVKNKKEENKFCHICHSYLNDCQKRKAGNCSMRKKRIFVAQLILNIIIVIMAIGLIYVPFIQVEKINGDTIQIYFYEHIKELFFNQDKIGWSGVFTYWALIISMLPIAYAVFGSTYSLFKNKYPTRVRTWHVISSLFLILVLLSFSDINTFSLRRRLEFDFPILAENEPHIINEMMNTVDRRGGYFILLTGYVLMFTKVIIYSVIIDREHSGYVATEEKRNYFSSIQNLIVESKTDELFSTKIFDREYENILLKKKDKKTKTITINKKSG